MLKLAWIIPADALRMVVEVKLASKSNSRKRMKLGGVVKYTLSDSAQSAREQIKWEALRRGWKNRFTKTDTLGLFCCVTYPDRRSDLDCEIVPDALEHAGVFPNDRAISVKLYCRTAPGTPPRVEIVLWKFTGKEQG